MARQYEKITYEERREQERELSTRRATIATIVMVIFVILPIWTDASAIVLFIFGAAIPTYFYCLIVSSLAKDYMIEQDRRNEMELRGGRAVLGMPPQRDCFKIALNDARAKGKKIIDKYLVGFSLDSGEPLWLSDNDMCSHGCVFAKTGVGKTLWLESLMLQQMARGRASGFTFIDAKRDSGVLADIILMALITGRIEDLIVVDPFDTIHSYNFVLTNQRADVKARKVLRAGLPPTSDQSATKHYDRLASDSINRMIRALESFGLAWSIKDVAMALSAFNLAYPHLKNMLEKIGAKQAVVELGHLAASYRDKKGILDTSKITDNLRGISSELHAISGSSMGEIFCTNYTDLNLTDAILRGKLIYFMLPRLEDAESAARMVKLFREDLEVSIGEITSSRQHNLEDPHLVIIDEGSSTFGPTWANLFELARKGRFSLLFGAQSTGGLMDGALGLSQSFYERVMANVNLKVMMRLGDNQTAADMAEWIGKINAVKRSIGSGVSSSVASSAFGMKETGGESQNISISEAEKDLVSPEELKHEMSAEKGLAYFDLGNGEIVKGRSFWFNADLPPTWEGREYINQFEKIENDEIGLAEWVDAKIYSIEQADLEDDEDSPRKPSTDKPQYSSSKNSKQSKPKPKTEENVSARSINLSSMNFKNKIFGGIKVKDSVSSRSQIKDNNKSAENEDKEKKKIIEEENQEINNENVVKVKEVKEPTKFKLSSSPKIRIRGAVSSFKRPKK